MTKTFSRFLIVGVLLIVLVSACSSDDGDKDNDRKRRSSTSSTTKDSTTTTADPATSTVPIIVLPLLTPAEIKTTWPQSKLCALVTPAQAQKILKMDTVPTAKYVYAETLGARCSYSSGGGDEMSIEISTASYKESRNIDSALNAAGDPVVITGVAGVKKKNAAFGTTFELNISGESSNQWTANAPTDAQAEEVAKALIKSVG